jgi:hypothetical protein
MARTIGHRGRWAVEVRQDSTWAQGWTPDPSWRYTDAAGHPHAYSTPETPWPTLSVRWVTYIDADGEERSDTWHECPRCGEHIVPGQTYGEIRIPGMIEATVHEKRFETWGVGEYTYMIETRAQADELVRRLEQTTTVDVRDTVIERFIEEHQLPATHVRTRSI